MTTPWRSFGRYEVLPLLDGVFETSSDVLIHARGDAARLRAIEDIGPTIAIDVNCFALRSDDRLMLVDSGTGSAWGPKLGHARGAMAAAGITPEAVERILLTHIHGDHALGLVEGTNAYFPDAEIMVPEADLDYFTDAKAEAEVPVVRRGGFDIVKILISAYAGRIKPIPIGPVLPEIDAVALPGHTPGHSGYLIGAGPTRLMLCGDVLHLSRAQARDPDLGLVYDSDPGQAVKTRRAVLAAAVAEGWCLAGGHILGFESVIAEEAGFRIGPG